MWNIIFTVLAVTVLILTWIMIYDSNRFVVRKYVLHDARIQKNVRAVVLADLHNKMYGRNNINLIEAIREAKPDIILVAGDILTAKRGDSVDKALNLLEELVKDYPVYYGNGNHEQRLELYPDTYGDMGIRYEEGLMKLNIQPIVNAHVKLGESGIVIYGVQIDRSYYKRFKLMPMENSYLRTLLGPVDKLSYSILLAHNPDYFPQYAQWGADLVLSGHVHGGIVHIPFVDKGVVSPAIRLFPKYDGGRFDEDGSTMIVSRGLGMHTIPIRLFNPGELLVLDFECGNVSSS